MFYRREEVDHCHLTRSFARTRMAYSGMRANAPAMAEHCGISDVARVRAQTAVSPWMIGKITSVSKPKAPRASHEAQQRAAEQRVGTDRARRCARFAGSR